MTFPAAVPEIPVSNIDQAAAYYANVLGFTLDWGDEQGGIAGVSRGNCRLFLANRTFRQRYGNVVPMLFWLNLDSKDHVDDLFKEWKAAQATIVYEAEDMPYKLREFLVADLEGNLNSRLLRLPKRRLKTKYLRISQAPNQMDRDQVSRQRPDVAVSLPPWRAL